MSAARALTETAAGAPARRRVRARVRGTVQGVGFRPYVFRLGCELRLGGWVRNDPGGVVCEVEGEPDAVERFLSQLAEQAPPLARVEAIEARELAARGQRTFAIRESPTGGRRLVQATADAATCDECLAELWNPADRRYRYPFINCTNCGPRFTILRSVPYDRARTTMSAFPMCERCRAEYEDPRDRRFHAEPNACPRCGPSLRLLDADGHTLGRAEGALAAAAGALQAGRTVAVKGIGGFHLACVAGDEAAVSALRARKRREEKPFAVMAADLAQARTLAFLGEQEERLLQAPARPIVLVRRRPGAKVADAVAPRAPELGVMLPYSPLHHLLLADAGAPLVMTSGNVSDEPIAYRDEDGLRRLGTIAELLLVHDRAIQTRTDDSVARVVAVSGGRRQTLRRSRGWVPQALPLPLPAQRPLLACGAELKSTFCLASGEQAWLGHHIGDLRGWETLRSYREGIEHFQRLFALSPAVVVHDLHPDYLSSAYALEREAARTLAVQHHHAHLAACLAEHRERGPVVAAIYDGSGHGLDGTAWGGELLVGGLGGFERKGHLLAVALPGGDAAVREPWRMACAWLAAAGEEQVPALPRPLLGRVDRKRWHWTACLASSELAPATTSMGRLFDAVAAMCGICPQINYEGQAAIELEGACAPAHGGYSFPVEQRDESLVLDARPLVAGVMRDVRRQTPVGVVAGRFHDAVMAATASACARLAGEHGLDTVALSGGVFQNRRLLEGVAADLGKRGLRVLIPELVPANDGGIAYGQAAVAAAVEAGGEGREGSG